MKTLIVAVVASAFSIGALAAGHVEKKGASAPMGKATAKPMAAPAAASAPMAKKAAASAPMAKQPKKAASAA